MDQQRRTRQSTRQSTRPLQERPVSRVQVAEESDSDDEYDLVDLLISIDPEDLPTYYEYLMDEEMSEELANSEHEDIISSILECVSEEDYEDVLEFTAEFVEKMYGDDSESEDEPRRLEEAAPRRAPEGTSTRREEPRQSTRRTQEGTSTRREEPRQPARREEPRQPARRTSRR